MSNSINFDKLQALTLSKGLPSENEDKYFFNKEVNFISLSDGAGGYGIFANEWAEHLTLNISPQHFDSIDIFQKQINEERIKFFNLKEQWLNENNPNYLEKFFREGSAATYVGVQINPEENKFRAIAYGDSAFFLIRPKDKSFMISNVNFDVFTNYPHLIECTNNNIENEYLYFKDIEFEQGDILILASDAIAQYLLIEFMLFDNKDSYTINTYLKYPHALANYINAIKNLRAAVPLDFYELINNLYNFNEDDFKILTKQLQELHALSQDDYTLILLAL